MENEIQVGDTVNVIIQVWREDETPSIENFYTGKITEIFERTKFNFYVRLEGLNDFIVPIDRVIGRA